MNSVVDLFHIFRNAKKEKLLLLSESESYEPNHSLLFFDLITTPTTGLWKKIEEVESEFLKLYGIGKNGDVNITKRNERVVILYKDKIYAFPRVSRGFIQFFTADFTNRIEFTLEKREKVTVVPEDRELLDGENETDEQFLDSDKWLMIGCIYVTQISND